MTTSQTQQNIIELYIATFNRAPDADGLAYWVSNVESSGWSLEQVAKSMFDSEEVNTTYPDTLSNTEFLNKVYTNVLGRDGDPDGVAYWLTQMEKGILKSQMITTIVNGAKADSGEAADKQYLENKKEAGVYFSVELKSNDLTLAKTSMEDITSDINTVQHSKDKQDLFIATSEATLEIILGDETKNIINGTEVNNFIYANAEDDTILASKGDNIIIAGDGTDTVQTGIGKDTIKGGNGDDTVYANEGDDMIHGNRDNDSLHGEAGNDTIYGDIGDDYIYGDDGDDMLYGGEGVDNIYAGIGDDIINGGLGNDYIYATDGKNFIDGDDGNDVIYGGLDIDTIYGGAGDDTIYGQEGDDIIDGLTDDDTIYGGNGNDKLNGNEGNDTIYGGTGDDMIDAEEGDDMIYGGLGIDTLVGGEGKDTFVFESLTSNITNLDTILDFTYASTGFDKITLIDKGTEVINSAKTVVSTANTLQEAANLASLGDGSTNAITSWFVYEDDTYIVEDLNVAVTFDDTTDVIIKLQGTLDLAGLNQDTLIFA